MAKRCDMIAEDYVTSCLSRTSGGYKFAGNFWIAGRIAMSYNEPIAAYHGGKFFVTTRKFSRTTSTHTAAICRAVERIAPGSLELVSDVTADTLKLTESEMPAAH